MSSRTGKKEDRLGAGEFRHPIIAAQGGAGGAGRTGTTPGHLDRIFLAPRPSATDSAVNICFLGAIWEVGAAAERPAIPTRAFTSTNSGHFQAGPPRFGCRRAAAGTPWARPAEGCCGAPPKRPHAVIKVSGAGTPVPSSRTRVPGHLGTRLARLFRGPPGGFESAACGATDWVRRGAFRPSSLPGAGRFGGRPQGDPNRLEALPTP